MMNFAADHGEQLGDHFMSGKQGFFEGSYHIPMIVRDPRPEAISQRGTVVDSFSEHVDILPTMMVRFDVEMMIL